MQIDADDADWCRLILIDVDWCWLILIDADWFKHTPVPWTSIFNTDDDIKIPHSSELHCNIAQAGVNSVAGVKEGYNLRMIPLFLKKTKTGPIR